MVYLAYLNIENNGLLLCKKKGNLNHKLKKLFVQLTTVSSKSIKEKMEMSTFQPIQSILSKNNSKKKENMEAERITNEDGNEEVTSDQVQSALNYLDATVERSAGRNDSAPYKSK